MSTTRGAVRRLGNSAVMGGAGEGEAAELARRVMDVHAAARGEVLRTVPVGDLARSVWQPRHGMEAEALEELAASIRSRGVLLPLLARELTGGRLELLAGERRLEAARLSGLATVPVRVLRDLSDAEAREVALVENLARSDLSPWEEAHAVAGLRDARRAEGRPSDVRSLAKVAGRGRTRTAELVAIADALTPAVVALASQSGPLVRTPDKLPHEALYGAAKGTTEAERARLLALYAGARAPATEAARRTKRSRAAAAGAKPFTMKGGTDGRLTLTVRRPVADLEREAAADLLQALRPIVEALEARLEARLEEAAGQQTQARGDTWERQ